MHFIKAFYFGNEIADAVLSKTLATPTKSDYDEIVKQERVEEIIIPPAKIEEIF